MFLDALLTLAHATVATTNLLGGKMKFKLRSLLAVALVSSFVFAPPAVPVQAKPPVSLGDGRAEEVGMSTQRLDKITSAFTKEINDKKLPGAVVIVARKGRVVYQNAFGLRDPKKSDPMGVDTIFRIYSMTKPLMSVGLMTLVEDGVVQLTDPVSKYLPPFKDVKVSTPTGDVAPDIVPLAAGSGNAPRRIQSTGIAVQQKRHHHPRVERRLPEPAHIAARDLLEIEALPHQPNDKPRDVVLGHEVLHARRQKQRLIDTPGAKILAHSPRLNQTRAELYTDY